MSYPTDSGVYEIHITQPDPAELTATLVQPPAPEPEYIDCDGRRYYWTTLYGTPGWRCEDEDGVHSMFFGEPPENHLMIHHSWSGEPPHPPYYQSGTWSPGPVVV